MFVKQTELIMDRQPWAVCLEISDNAVNVNDGREVRKVQSALEVAYVVYTLLIPVWKLGDPSNRKRLFMVALHKELEQAAYEFKWPTELLDDTSVPVARMFADLDSEVDPKYWRYDAIQEKATWENENFPTRLHVISRTGKGMGHSSKPNSILSWDCLLNGPTRYGGGARRTELNWKSGE